MGSPHAERPAVTAAGLRTGSLSTPWGTLTGSQVRELALPGALIGPLGGAIAGAFAAVGSQSLPVVLVAAFGLGVPLALAGAAYELLLATGRIPLGTLTPAAMLWVAAFPPSCVFAAALVDLVAGTSVAVPHGWLAFIVYQMLVSVPFAIGFWWLHENFAPRWWYHLRERNPVAAQYMGVLIQHAGATEQREQRRKQRRRKPRRDSGG